MQFVEHGYFGAGKHIGVEGKDCGLMTCSQSRVWRGVDGSSQWFWGDDFVSAMVGCGVGWLDKSRAGRIWDWV